MRFTKSDAQRVAAVIVANVADVDAGRISWDEFSARQLAAWKSVDQGELCFLGSDCDRRMSLVRDALRALDVRTPVVSVCH
jgi:hypothetical protein